VGRESERGRGWGEWVKGGKKRRMTREGRKLGHGGVKAGRWGWRIKRSKGRGKEGRVWGSG